MSFSDCLDIGHLASFVLILSSTFGQREHLEHCANIPAWSRSRPRRGRKKLSLDSSKVHSGHTANPSHSLRLWFYWRAWVHERIMKALLSDAAKTDQPCTSRFKHRRVLSSFKNSPAQTGLPPLGLLLLLRLVRVFRMPQPLTSFVPVLAPSGQTQEAINLQKPQAEQSQASKAIAELSREDGLSCASRANDATYRQERLSVCQAPPEAGFRF